MKTRKRRLSLLLALVMVATMLFTACTAVQVSGNLELNSDGSGTRTIRGSIAKNDLIDGYGSSYYYFKLHGDELASYIADVYADKVAGSKDWLTVSVDDSGEEWELVDLTFTFDSFEDYTAKLTSLAYDENFAGICEAPGFSADADGNITYSESINVMTAIMKSLQATIMADDTIFDINSTKDGEALNDGSADEQSLIDYGVELMKPDFGASMTISLDGAEAIELVAENGVYSYGAAPAAESGETTCVLHYTFDDTLANSGTMADNDLTYGEYATAGGPVFEDGLDGKAIKLDGYTYLASPNKSYDFKDLTISFDYRMDGYTETDSGANMILVPAGLGALGAGVIDVEFIKEVDAEGIQLLGKMNSSDWLTQDKLFSEGYLMESHMGEWHNYTLVYQNEYDDAGEVEDSFVFMYIDGKLAAKSRLAVAAGLTFSLGMFDDSIDNPNGGFNVGGYYEAELAKRGATGALDNLMVFNGALSEEEINELCYTVKVDKEYDPNATEEPAPTEEAVPETTAPVVEETTAEGGNNTTLIIVIAAVVIAAIAAGVVVSKKKKTDK